MIRHIVFFSARDPADVDLIVDTLRTYIDIPEVLSLEVERNARCDSLSDDIDVVLHACFASAEALERYKQHPLYHAGIDVVRPIRLLRHVVDYEVPDADER